MSGQTTERAFEFGDAGLARGTIPLEHFAERKQPDDVA